MTTPRPTLTLPYPPLTPRELARIAEVSERCVDRWAYVHKLPTLPPLKHVFGCGRNPRRIDLGELSNWMRAPNNRMFPEPRRRVSAWLWARLVESTNCPA